MKQFKGGFFPLCTTMCKDAAVNAFMQQEMHGLGAVIAQQWLVSVWKQRAVQRLDTHMHPGGFL